jgi:hypothetical protein
MKPKLTIDDYGYEEWKLPNGKFHREDGPAIEYSNGSKHWYLNGISYTEQEYKYKTRFSKLKLLLH